MSYQDSVHGQIRLTPLQLDLLELPELQRLGAVNQLGLKDLVYTGATHTRKAHSVGVSHIAKKIGEDFGIPGDEIEMLTATGLIHDIAHPPLSHTLEGILPKNHMEYAKLVFSGELYPERTKPTIPEVLSNHGIDPKEVIALINGRYEGKKYLQDIIKGPMDADQMDFLQRDAHHTRQTAGSLRQSRLIEVMRLHNEGIVFAEKGIGDIERAWYMRKDMYETVYLHAVARVAETMVSKATRQVIDRFPIEQLLRFRDKQFLYELSRQGDYQHEIVRRIEDRNLFKRAVELSSHKANIKERLGTVTELSRTGAEKLENEIAEESGIDSNFIIVDFPLDILKITEDRIDPSKDADILLKNGKVMKLTELRETAKVILKEPPTANIFAVYTPEENVNTVAEAVNDMYFNNSLVLVKRR